MIGAYFIACLLVVVPSMMFVSSHEMLASSGTSTEVNASKRSGVVSASLRGSTEKDMKEAVEDGYYLVGAYSMEDGPSWSSAPPTYSCKEACFKIFGRFHGEYVASISDKFISNSCYYEQYGGSSTNATELSESFSNCSTYKDGCYSAYVQHHVGIQPSKNFCYQRSGKGAVAPEKPSLPLVPNAYRGSYRVNSGPPKSTFPRTVTCQAECAFLFGGVDSDYQGSTSATSITNTCYAQEYAGTHNPVVVAEDYYYCLAYNVPGCTSAYVQDTPTTATNYCYNRK